MSVSDYTSFVKRVIRLVQTYLSVKNVELELRPFTDDDESLDVRGQSLVSSSSTVVTSSAPAAVNDCNTEVTAPGDGNASTQRKTRKKRSSRKSEEIAEEVTPQQEDKGFDSYYYEFTLIFYLYVLLISTGQTIVRRRRRFRIG